MTTAVVSRRLGDFRWWYAVAGICLLTAGVLMPRDWYDPLTRRTDLPEPPVRGVTLLQGSLVAEGIFLLVLACRRRNDALADTGDAMIAHPEFGGDISPRVAAWALTTITGVALLLRAWRLSSDLWLDEIVSVVDYGRLSSLEVIAAYYGTNNHLLNTLLMKASIGLFGESEWSIRLPAMLFGTAAIPVVYAVACQCASRLVSVGSALLLAVSYHHIFFSQNARGYAGHVTLSLLAALLLVRALRSGRRAAWGWYLAVMVLNVAVLLHGVFVAAGHGLVAAFWLAAEWRRGRLQPRRAWQAASAFAAMAFLVFQVYATVLPQAYVFITHVYSSPASGFQAWTSEFWVELVRGIAQGLPPFLLLAAVPGAVIAGVGAIVLSRREPVLAAAVVVPLALLALVLGAGGFTLSPRFFLGVLPIACVVVVEGLFSVISWIASRVALRRVYASAAATGAVTLAAAAATVPLADYYTISKQPYRAALAYAESQRGKDGTVVAVHLAEKGYDYYAARQGLRLGRDYHLSRTVESLDHVVALHPPQSVILVTTLPRSMRLELPDLKRRIEDGWIVAREFPATVGGGAITVWRPRLVPTGTALPASDRLSSDDRRAGGTFRRRGGSIARAIDR